MSHNTYWKQWQAREEYGKIRKSIKRLGTYVSSTELVDTEKVILSSISPQKTVLDVGAGSCMLKDKLIKAGFKGVYKTMDINREFSHDFYSLEEISGKYDAILILEVIEHIRFDEFNAMINELETHLSDKGSFIISTPNAYHINQVWRADMTHIQAYPLHDLYTYFTVRGYNCEPFWVDFLWQKNTIYTILRRLIYRIWCKCLMVESAEGVLLVAKKL